MDDAELSAMSHGPTFVTPHASDKEAPCPVIVLSHMHPDDDGSVDSVIKHVMGDFAQDPFMDAENWESMLPQIGRFVGCEKRCLPQTMDGHG